jgi:hypothetical protein
MNSPKSPTSPKSPSSPLLTVESHFPRPPGTHQRTSGRSHRRPGSSEAHPTFVEPSDLTIAIDEARQPSPKSPRMGNEMAFLLSMDGGKSSAEESIHLDPAQSKLTVQSLCAVLQLWLHGLGDQLAGANAAALDAEDALRQLKSRKWSAERVIAVIADVVTAASSPRRQ